MHQVYRIARNSAHADSSARAGQIIKRSTRMFACGVLIRISHSQAAYSPHTMAVTRIGRGWRAVLVAVNRRARYPTQNAPATISMLSGLATNNQARKFTSDLLSRAERGVTSSYVISRLKCKNQYLILIYEGVTHSSPPNHRLLCFFKYPDNEEQYYSPYRRSDD